jgi:hypothetical protein
MTEYELNSIAKAGFEINAYNSEIYIGIGMIKDNNLTDEELLNYVSDSLTHEHIHKALLEIFNETISKLFDVVGHNFRDNNLQDKYLESLNKIYDTTRVKKRITWNEYIKMHGFMDFIRIYNISPDDLNNATIICNTRDL